MVVTVRVIQAVSIVVTTVTITIFTKKQNLVVTGAEALILVGEMNKNYNE